MTIPMIVLRTTDGVETAKNWSQVIFLFMFTRLCLWIYVRLISCVNLGQWMIGHAVFCSFELMLMSVLWIMGYDFVVLSYDFWAICYLNHVNLFRYICGFISNICVWLCNFYVIMAYITNRKEMSLFMSHKEMIIFLGYLRYPSFDLNTLVYRCIDHGIL